MRALLLPMLLVAVRGSTFAANEACHFTGSRFARTNSTCDMGVCSNMGRLESGAFVPLTKGMPALACSVAQVQVAAFLAQQARPVRRSKRRRKDREDWNSVIDELERNVFPLLDELAFGILVPYNTVQAALLAFDRLVLVMAAEDTVTWTDSTAREVLNSPVLSRMTEAYRRIIRSGIQRPLTAVDLHRSLIAAIHFYFDFAALLGSHFVSRELLIPSGFVMGVSSLEYRATTQWELVADHSNEGVPGNTAAVLQVSRVLDLVGQSREALSRSDLVLLYRFMAGWERSPPSTSRTLLAEQIVSSICPRLINIVQQLARVHHRSEALTRVIVGFLEECRDGLSPAFRNSLRRHLAAWRHLSGNAVRLPEAITIDTLLRESALLAWDSGLTGLHTHSVARDLIADFVEAKVGLVPLNGYYTFTFGDDNQSPWGFGRAIGFSILHGVDLRHLRLSSLVVKLLHPRTRQSAGKFAHIAVAIAPTITAAIVNVVSGLEEVMGRGGFEIYSDAEWLAIFGLGQ